MPASRHSSAPTRLPAATSSARKRGPYCPSTRSKYTPRSAIKSGPTAAIRLFSISTSVARRATTSGSVSITTPPRSNILMQFSSLESFEESYHQRHLDCQQAGARAPESTGGLFDGWRGVTRQPAQQPASGRVEKRDRQG